MWTNEEISTAELKYQNRKKVKLSFKKMQLTQEPMLKFLKFSWNGQKTFDTLAIMENISLHT